MNTGANNGGFFSRFDIAAFWTATIATGAVYLYTLGPSVGCEDSGELATAAAHLGVPHPPGYPFWTFCSWLVCKAFSFVTYMGHPTPAWATSLLSAVFGALAAGCTAMLICRSAQDFLRSDAKPWLCFGGGVGGALAFSFSPVEWSQSTIVEIYSLNALFLMWVFLLSYRWMRSPSDKILWLTALVFGLGLTNYQVLLFAMAPLAIIICLKNLKLVRDFLLYLIPAAMAWQVLDIGAMQRASANMQSGAIAKHLPLTEAASCPSTIIVAAAAIALAATLAAMAALKNRKGETALRKIALNGGVAAASLLALGALGIFASPHKWTFTDVAPLVDPRTYAWIAASVAASVAAGAAASVSTGSLRRNAVAASAAFAIVAAAIASSTPVAGLDGYAGEPFGWGGATYAFAAMAAALFALAWFTPNGMCYAIPVAGMHLAAFILLKHGAMNGLAHPASWWFWWPVAWNGAVLALAWLVLPNGRSVAGAALFAQIGVSFYAYMPIVSDLRNPPMNWGYPRTWDGFKHALTRGQYEAISLPDFPDLGAAAMFIKTQVGHYFSDIKMQFSDILVFFALLPFSAWSVKVSRGENSKKLHAVHVAGALLCILLARAVASAAGFDGGERLRGALEMFDRAILGAMSIVAAAGLAIVVWRQIVLRLVAAAVPRRLAANLVRRMRRSDSMRLEFNAPAVSQQWLFASAVCFFMMTVPLILLAQVKGDLQDGFIQKVKFISSHAMIALWIGYGLAIGATIALSRWRKAPRIAGPLAAASIILGAGIVPVVQNYADDEYTQIAGVNEIVHKFGGSEQNGHTFGWQFGAYQLDGCKAIREQISADEEPLPDPDWPEPMEPYSIFFGGTDPGRFVPTYMIYSADFRPDVYLITQNALADDTYMSVERDLYGDEIWIPAKEDSAAAFERYVDEVRRGVRQANGDLKIENGRVQVTGALGVMEINSILTQMMFEHDRTRHSFYVEESYPIKWMYPYLSPHGLIMKINPDCTPYSPETAEKDRDFWDWYSKRLLEDPMYVRDFAAQKSFSKLRAAIGGLYVSQARRVDAANAYREAILLYQASPEASFRYINEILAPSDRLDTIAELLDHIDRLDPNNRRTGNTRRYIHCRREVARLEAARARSALAVADALVLAQCYLELGAAEKAAEIASLYAAAAHTPDELLDLAMCLYAGGKLGEARAAFARYFALVPAPPLGVWLEYASILTKLQATAEASKIYDQAFRANPQAALQALSSALEQSGRTQATYPLWLMLAKFAFRSGDMPTAAQAFDAAYSIAPDRIAADCAADRDLNRLVMAIMQQQQRQQPMQRRR